MLRFESQLSAAKARYDQARPELTRNLQLIREQRPFLADSKERVHKWFRRRGYSADLAERATTTGTVPDEVREVFDVPSDEVGLERVLGTSDFLGVAFLEQALRVARTVCRISVGGLSGSPAGFGTGFLVAPRLLLTNHHVLGSEDEAAGSVAEFDYYIRADGVPASVRVFSLEPTAFFVTDANLDFTLVAVAERGTGNVPLTQYSWNQLIPEEGKVVVGQWVNIIQHPSGEPKQLVLRNNEIVNALENFVQYVADTSPGSSGSPVYNDRWEIIGLHHSGVPARDKNNRILNTQGGLWREEQGEHRIKWISNEGVRLSRIVKFVKAAKLTPAKRALFQEGLQAPSRRALPVESQSDVDGRGSASDAGAPVAQVAADGTATWTIPLRVSVQLGYAGGPPAGVRPAPGSSPAVAGDDLVASTIAAAPSDETALLNAARNEFTSRSDVLDVRLGYRFENDWITDDRAIVVKVSEKRSVAELSRDGVSALPATFQGYPVQVTGPTLADLVAERSRGGVAELREVLERRFDEITYTKLNDVPLTPVTASMTATLSVSPDAGWPQLEGFLKGAKKSLVIGMYDFGAPHIVKVLEGIRARTFAELVLTMQRGESLGTGTKKNDLSDQEVVDRLRTRFRKKLKFGWIKIGVKNGWVASSYHIKVAVRDGAAFWLSSGNWQTSNQPEVDLAGTRSTDFSFLKSHNREWHAVIAHKGLASTFGKYLRHDFDDGTDEQLTESLVALPTIVLPELAWFDEAAPAFKYFPPLALRNRTLTVAPLLTPDNYFDALIQLVRGARREILIQNQTFNAPKENHAKLTELMELLVDKQKRMPVRIVFRVLHAPTARENLEALKDMGFDTTQIRVQPNLHTKGVIVDGAKVLLGSQNISEQGISINRDASLVFDNAGIAGYFKTIFQHDWDHLAKKSIGRQSARGGTADEALAAGEPSLILTPKEYIELL